MGRVNKTSLREELDYLKSEFARLSSTKKISPESMVLFKGMFMLFEVMVAVFLEKQTKKDSQNSSTPSSQTDKDESSTKAGTQSKGKEENGQTFSNSRTKETTKVSKATFCNTCGEDLEDTPCDNHERRTKIDIVFEKGSSNLTVGDLAQFFGRKGVALPIKPPQGYPRKLGAFGVLDPSC